MANELKTALNNYKKNMDANRKSDAACYDSFFEYCKEEGLSQYPLKKLFVEYISMHSIVEACRTYIEGSKKARKNQAIDRYLIAMDKFYVNYIKKQGIICDELEAGCHRKEVINDVVNSVNEKLGNRKITVPMKSDEINAMEDVIKTMNCERHYQYGQIVRYRLMLEYGFKSEVLLKLRLEQFDAEELSLNIEYDEDAHFKVLLDEELGNMVKRYCEMNCQKDRKWLFTNADGKKIASSYIMDELSKRAKENFAIAGFSPMAVGLTGVQKLLEKGMTVAEIKMLTGFGINKIEDVAEYMLVNLENEKVINEKLSGEYYKRKFAMN